GRGGGRRPPQVPAGPGAKAGGCGTATAAQDGEGTRSSEGVGGECALTPCRGGPLVAADGDRLAARRGQGGRPDDRIDRIADVPHAAVHHHGLDAGGGDRLWGEPVAPGLGPPPPDLP